MKTKKKTMNFSTSTNNILKNNTNNSGVHNIPHNFMSKTLNDFNIIHTEESCIMKFHEGQIVSQKSYGNFKMTRTIRMRSDEYRLRDLGHMYLNKKGHSILYLSRYKNSFKLKNTIKDNQEEELDII